MIRSLVRAILRPLGYDVVRYSPLYHPEARWHKIFSSLHSTVVFDVGANEGEFGLLLRSDGYKGRIISFEPRTAAFEILRSEAKRDGNWKVEKCALSDLPGEAEIHVSGHAASSSLLKLAPWHEKRFPNSREISKEKIEIRQLDSFLPAYVQATDRLVVKIDVQGLEMKVLHGAGESLRKAEAVFIELSLRSLYEGSALIEEVIAFLRGVGFVPVTLSPVLSDSLTAELLQIDALFLKVAGA
jgi:FkbM family methyltransferase